MSFLSLPHGSGGVVGARASELLGNRLFWGAKRSFDIIVSLLALPILGCIAIFLLVLNPFFNRGHLFYRQTRMGRGQSEFEMFKFRTMEPSPVITRGPGDPVEHDRITPLGYWMRRMRMDELPQIINVLLGHMSLIGPRPDYIEHARDFAATVPSYCERHVIRPGISGYAQVRLGYAEGRELAETKTRLDVYYIENVGWRLELWILVQTFGVILSGKGAR